MTSVKVESWLVITKHFVETEPLHWLLMNKLLRTASLQSKVAKLPRQNFTHQNLRVINLLTLGYRFDAP